MRRRLTVAVLVLTGTLLVSGTPAASADSVRPADLLTVAEVASIYPAMDGGKRFARHAPFYVGDPDDCAQSVTLRTTGKRTVSFLERMGQQEGPFVQQRIARFATVGRAAGALRQFRSYAERCAGRTRTGNPAIGVSTRTLRPWKGLPWDGRGKVATLVKDASVADVYWTGTTVARVGRTVVVLEVTRDDRRPDKADSVALHRLAVASLRR